MTTATYRVVFEFSYSAWMIHLRNDTIDCDQQWHNDHAELAEAAIGENPTHLEDWSATILQVDQGQHPAIQAGDAVYCEEYGRLSDALAGDVTLG